MSLLAELSLEFGAPQREIANLIASAPRRYKVYTIPKRDGINYRIIAQPASEIKDLQRYVLRTTLRKFKVHEIAYAYVSGKNIRKNAEKHLKSEFILKLDFTDFFPSIKPRDFELANRRTMPTPVSRLDLELLYHLLFWGNGGAQPSCLSIGAPTSPMISNIVMYKLDNFLQEMANDLDLIVTRYADDITVSGSSSERLQKFEKRFSKILDKSPSPSLRLNHKKRGLYSRGEKRMVTGLIITPDGKISIGRERKREISSLIHHISLGETEVERLLLAKGLLGFVISAEPTFILSLNKKYGRDLITNILSYQVK